MAEYAITGAGIAPVDEIGPEPPDTGEDIATIRIDCGALQAVKHAMAKQDVRYYLNGFCISEGEIVAADGHRLARHRNAYTGDLPHQVIVPADAVKFLPKKGMIECRITERFAIFPGMAAKLIDGKFPDYNRVIPEAGQTLGRVPVDTIKKAQEIVKARKPGGTPALEFTPDSAVLHMKGEEPRRITDTTDFPWSAAFKLGYLSDIVKAAPAGTIRQSRGTDPMRVDSGDLTLVSMPTRV